MSEPREQFTFYRSYFDAISELSKKDQASIILAVCEYALYEAEPTGLSPTAKACFALIRPTLDSGRRKAASGKQGGKTAKANSKQTGSKTEANSKQTEREKEGEIEKEKEIEKENECYICTELPAVISLPLNDGTEFPVTQDMLLEFSALYPAVDVMQELRNMRGWLLNNPKNRKTRSGIRRFINSWLSREQNRGGAHKVAQPAYTHGADRLAAMIVRGDFDD